MVAMEPGYEIEDSPEGRSLVLVGPWAPGAEEALRSGQVDGLILNYALGFSEPNLEFIQDWPLQRLKVLDRGLRDLAPISRLAASLRDLSVQVAAEAYLDLAPLSHLETVSGEWGLLQPTLEYVESLRDLVTWRFDEPDLLSLASHAGLKCVTIKEAPQLETLQGIEALEALEVLGVHLARRLTDIQCISTVAATLRRLRFEDCPGLDAIDELGELTGLRELWVADCGPIGSLAPIAGMSRLERFLAWGSTRIMDGDLSPLATLAHLREVRMRSRRDYRPPLAQIQRSLRDAP